MEKIYVIQMHTGTFPAKVVKIATRYPYSHVGISLDERCETIYSFGRKKPRNFLNGGFVKQKSSDEFFKIFSNVHCRVYELDVSDGQLNALKAALGEYEANPEMYKYDFGGLFLRTFFNLPVEFEHRYVCSQFVAKTLSDIGCLDIVPRKAKPKDFEAINGTRLIYSGAYPIAQTI